MATRRQILKAITKTAAATSLVAVSGVSIWQLSLQDTQQTVEQDDYDYEFFTLDDRLVLFAITPVILGSALKPDERESSIIFLIQQLDKAISFTSRISQEELRQLFDILANQLGRAFLAGVWQSWNRAKPKEIQQFLKEWRDSFLTILRSGYLGLHQMVMGTFYSLPESWQTIGYPGPPKLNLDDEFYQQFDL